MRRRHRRWIMYGFAARLVTLRWMMGARVATRRHRRVNIILAERQLVWENVEDQQRGYNVWNDARWAPGACCAHYSWVYKSRSSKLLIQQRDCECKLTEYCTLGILIWCVIYVYLFKWKFRKINNTYYIERNGGVGLRENFLWIACKIRKNVNNVYDKIGKRTPDKCHEYFKNPPVIKELSNNKKEEDFHQSENTGVDEY